MIAISVMAIFLSVCAIVCSVLSVRSTNSRLDTLRSRIVDLEYNDKLRQIDRMERELYPEKLESRQDFEQERLDVYIGKKRVFGISTEQPKRR